jgi:hypothetical protein
MNKKTMMVLAALGIAQAKETLANDLMGLPVVNSTNPAIVAQSLQVNVDTVRVLRMFADMEHFNLTMKVVPLRSIQPTYPMSWSEGSVNQPRSHWMKVETYMYSQTPL